MTRLTAVDSQAFLFMDISELIGETTDFEVDWKGKKIKFTARTASLTPHLLSNIKTVEGYAAALSGVLTDWDLTDGEKPWPTTEESVARLPVPFLSAVLDKIGESWAGDAKKNEASASG